MILTEQEKIRLSLPAIKAMTDICNIEIEHVEFIPVGKSNESYIVVSPNGIKYLARIAGLGTEKFIDRKKELHNVIIAEQIGVSPKLICHNNNNLLLEFIEGTCTQSQDILYLNENVDKITLQLRKLHESPLRFKGEFSFINNYLLFKKDFLSTNNTVPELMQKYEDELYDITKWIDNKFQDQICPVHSDIVLQNFVFTHERAYIVDWENSFMADPYVDLASFCTQNILGPNADRLFLKSYFSGMDNTLDYGKFLLFKMAVSFMWIYWHLNNIAHNKDVEYNEYRWRMHLNNAIICKEDWRKLL